MTTEPPDPRASTRATSPRRAARALVPPLVASATCVALVALLALALGPAGAASFALVGGALGAGVLAAGAALVHPVATLAPHLSLVSAMTTYALQLVVVLAVLVSLERSGTGSTVERGWLFAALAVSTITWLVTHPLGVAREARRADVEDGLHGC